jgi:hypothetical protein
MQNPSLDAHIWHNIRSLKNTRKNTIPRLQLFFYQIVVIGLAYQSKDIVFRFIMEYS